MRVKGWDKFQHFKDRRPPWIKLYRDILDDIEWHVLDGDSAKNLVMIWLLASEGKNGELPPVKELAFRLRVSESRVKSIVSKLENWLEQDDSEMVSERYQDDIKMIPLARSRETETETEKNNTMSGKPDGDELNNKKTTKKNGFKPQAIEIINFLNEKADRSYRPVQTNLELIISRLEEGYEIQDFRAVIARKVRDWSDDEKMAKFLRPATLFNKTKFAQYSGEGNNNGVKH